MVDSSLLAFLLVAGVLTITPGADTMLVFRNVLRGGARAGVSTTFGICGGLFLHATLSAFGLSLILMRSAELYAAVKLAGALYLVWLGLVSIREAWIDAEPAVGGNGARRAGRPRRPRPCFLEGMITNALNPKVAIFYLAFLPQFIAPTDPVFARSMLLATIHGLMGLVWLTFLSGLLARAGATLAHGRARRAMDAAAGIVLVGLGVRLAVEKA